MMLNRRILLQSLAATGIGSATLHRATVALAFQDEAGGLEITADTIKQAEWVSGNELSDEQREALVDQLNRNSQSMESLRKQPLTAADMPAISFQPLISQSDSRAVMPRAVSLAQPAAAVRSDSDSDLAFLPVTELSQLIKTKQVTSTELTEIYLARLKKYNPMLKFYVNLTEELAMESATRADRELAAGTYRGPLHGIPWGAKDLVNVPGYPTTWGIPQKRAQELNEGATVFHRLQAAGAVLVAKLSLGALAMGDRWFGGPTRSPWDFELGSSGSSAGSASATVAGCVGFSLGSETLGSIISPSRRCGSSGLRPTFGRVSRHGCMPLSWTMDKIGPITRSVEDTALVLAAIHGADGKDPTAIDQSFSWPAKVNIRSLKVGYTPSRRREAADREDLRILRDLGVKTAEYSLPDSIQLRALTNVIGVEGAAVFEEMLNRDDTEGWNSWPNTFRASQFMSAVDYLRIMRWRRKLMHEFEISIRDFDALVNVNDLLHTNLTGHPSVVFPVGYRERAGRMSPQSAILTGHLFDETRLLALAHAYQSQVTAHLEHPPLDDLLLEFQNQQKTVEAEEAETGDQGDAGDGDGGDGDGG